MLEDKFPKWLVDIITLLFFFFSSVEGYLESKIRSDRTLSTGCESGCCVEFIKVGDCRIPRDLASHSPTGIDSKYVTSIQRRGSNIGH